ncbi:MAG: DEAD/DEAH box helicase family protein [Lachnospiraceae bacterium oral taxon 082]|nr:DEAD/DEAH box helicase family protein [Lachnospiraceae bacterium oral taxon 082]
METGSVNDLKTFVEVKSCGDILPKNGTNIRSPYEHQKKAMEALDKINKEESYSTLVVLPTGGGKTYTASMWLLKNAIDKKKKILWIAHRQMLLDQAAESFQKFAYTEVVPHISSFRFRIVSGASSHDRTIDIKADDNLLIISKDSIGRNIDRLDKWLEGEKELYLVVDEAHHSTAKTYRKVINYVKDKVPNLKLIGLTATPFRTAEEEQGLLGKIYSDGVSDGQVVRGDIGITYQIGLKELINRQILSKPIFESYFTEENYGDSLGLESWERIQYLDNLPEGIASQMAESAARNKLIVETYKEKQDEYGQTIVFAVNVIHAIQLSELFNKAGIKSDFVVSDIRDGVTGVTVSREDNERKLEAYRNGELQVLVNVNILTEGVDLPKTKTVFLARPTVSSILMTQMVGRALRGTAAGGTSSAYIVSFIDHWNEHIAWVNPESLFAGDNEFQDSDDSERIKRDIQLIAISKIEEFARILDNSVDTLDLERVAFEKRIPIGMYAFNYLEENGMDHSYQVMVYDSTQEAYKNLMESLPSLFKSFDVTEEYLTKEQLDEMEEQCRDSFFCGEMIPPYESRDVINIIKYYAQYEEAPRFYTFEEVDRNKLDISKIAQHIWDNKMDECEKAKYIDNLWDSGDDNILRLFFGRKLYFLKQFDIEMLKIAHPDVYEKEIVKYGKNYLESLPLHEIGKIRPDLEKMLRDSTFEKHTDKEGNHCCALCGFKDRSRASFHVDHIIAMNNGGKSVVENLQILCRSCNARKSDK